tara:strand:- start:174 stop:356 length:183 start_codon:yes stop_codon:yes gene_type:complete
MHCTKHEQDEKNLIIKLLQEYNGSWDNLKKEKLYKQTIQYFKKLKLNQNKGVLKGEIPTQ